MPSGRALIILLVEKYLKEEMLLIPMHCLAGSRISNESLRIIDVVALRYILPNCSCMEIFPRGFSEGITVSLATHVKVLYLFCFV